MNWGDPRLERSRNQYPPRKEDDFDHDEYQHDDDMLDPEGEETSEAHLDDEREKLAFGREWR